MQITTAELHADLKESSDIEDGLGMCADLNLTAQLSNIHENSEPNISKGLEMPEGGEKDLAQTPVEAREDIDLLKQSQQDREERDQTHDFINPYSQPLLKISLVDERLSGDTGGTKPVL